MTYTLQAVKQLNISAQNWKDLLTDEPFKRKDIITIQDPHNLQVTALAVTTCSCVLVTDLPSS